MFKKDNLKEFFRFCLNLTALAVFNFWAFPNLLVNEENFNNFVKNISLDLYRFLNLNISLEVVYLIFILFISLIITNLVLLTKWYLSPNIFNYNKTELYFKIFQKTTLGTIFILYFLRVFNISRINLILYLVIVPFVFIFFQTEGIFSKLIIRQHNQKKFLLINYRNTLNEEIYMNNYINKSDLLIEIEAEKKENLYEKVLKMQKEYQYDLLVFNTNNIENATLQILLELTKIRKPIYIFTDNLIESSYYKKLILRKLENNFLNIYKINPTVQDGIQLLTKRTLDITLTIILLIVFSPLYIFLALFIYFQDFKNPIVKLPRSGIYGKEFKMYKFRTMMPDSHNKRSELKHGNQRKGPLFKLENDPRIIPRLKWIRKFSLDEIPQFLNVVKGEMSLVGPRPLFHEDLFFFRDEETIRLTVLPGITGFLQINSRETEDFKVWHKYDKQYIDNWSIWLDLKILLLTPFKLKSSF